MIRKTLLSLVAVSAVFGLGSEAAAQVVRSEQVAVREQRKRGEVMPLRMIEMLVLPRMGKREYLGPTDYDRENQIYRLKFIEDQKRVIFVDVDATTGRIIRRR